jgi:ribonuclease HII
VLFDYERLTRSQVRALGRLDDSKVHDLEGREELYPLVLHAAARIAVTSRCARGIDERGLHKTNLAALRDCLCAVAVPGTVCLVDGFGVAEFEHEQRAVIDGDARSAAIAAASVIAKVTRDRYMRRAAEELPGWHFHSNVGYSTPEHREAIAQQGISWLHRRSFQSVAYQQLGLEGDGSAIAL